MTDATPTTPEEPQEPTAEPTNHGGFAVYDLTLTRFVTGVYSTKSAATKALSKASGHEYETRKV